MFQELTKYLQTFSKVCYLSVVILIFSLCPYAFDLRKMQFYTQLVLNVKRSFGQVPSAICIPLILVYLINNFIIAFCFLFELLVHEHNSMLRFLTPNEILLIFTFRRSIRLSTIILARQWMVGIFIDDDHFLFCLCPEVNVKILPQFFSLGFPIAQF